MALRHQVARAGDETRVGSGGVRRAYGPGPQRFNAVLGVADIQEAEWFGLGRGGTEGIPLAPALAVSNACLLYTSRCV